MRITLSDATRAAELRDFLRSVHAIAVIVDDAVEATLVASAHSTNDERQLAAYVRTWVELYAPEVRVELD